jgi:hypothetical protein
MHRAFCYHSLAYQIQSTKLNKNLKDVITDYLFHFYCWILRPLFSLRKINANVLVSYVYIKRLL